MEFTSLTDSGLGITREELAALFQPFVTQAFDDNDEPWRAEIRRRQVKILRKYLKRVLLGWLPSTQRREHTVIEEYSKAWQPSEYEKYNLQETPARISPWEWGKEKLFASDVGATRFRQLILIRLIEQGKIDTQPWVTHRMPLNAVPEEFPSLYEKPDLLKAVIDVEGES